MTAFDQAQLAQIKTTVPQWRAAQMDGAFQVFNALEEPTGAEEDWRYVEFDHSFSELSPVTAPGERLPPGPFVSSLPRRSGHVLIVDGAVVEHESEVASVSRFSDLEADPGLPTLLPVDHNKLAAAHAAFSGDGVHIELEPGVTMDSPLVVEVQAATEGSASFPHLHVAVGENAEASILVVYRSADGARLLLLPKIDLEVGDG
ncbi:MAG TPA: hypothetical protein VF083_12715, partial [Acidimicrobiia bacterium]